MNYQKIQLNQIKYKDNQLQQNKVSYENLTNERFIFSQLFLKNLFILRLLGACPLSFKKLKSKSTGEYYVYKFKWKSLHIVYSLLVQTAAIFTTCFAVTNILNGSAQVNHLLYLFPDLTNVNQTASLTLPEYVTSAYFILLYICSSAITLVTFWTTPKMAVLLNCWSVFYFKKFLAVFPTYGKLLRFSAMNSIFFKRLLWKCTTLLICLTFFIKTIMYCIHDVFSTCTLADKQVSLISVVFSAITGSIIAIEVFTLRSMNELVVKTFEQIHEACVKSPSFVPTSKFFKLVYFVRKQHQQVEKAFGPIFFVLAGFYFASTITNWIIVLWLIRGEVSAAIAISTLAFSFVQLATFHRLVAMNERVLNAENQIIKACLSSRHLMSKFKDKFEVHNFSFDRK